MTWHSFYCFSRCLGPGKRTIGPMGSLRKGVFEPRTLNWIKLRAVPLQSVESKLAEDWRERNGREGNWREAWKAGRRNPPPPQLPPGSLFFTFARFARFPRSHDRVLRDYQQSKTGSKWGLFYFNVPSCDATTFVQRLYFLLMNLLTNAKSPLLIGLLRSKTPLFRTVYLWTNTTRTSGSEWISISRSSQTNTTTSWVNQNFSK